jgi:hypothetical protein
MQISKCKIQIALIRVCVLNFAFSVVGCSIPNLEPPMCTEARNAVREFYSFHFGNDMAFSLDNLKKRERFLSPELVKKLLASADGNDPFTTGSKDFPKAFRVGECREIAPDKVELQVLLFWRDDVRSEQQELKTIVIKQNDNWLLDDMSAAPS